MTKFYPGKQAILLLLLAVTQIVSNAQISTFAGRRYYLGDNGPALSAGLFAPNAIARDSAGNIYIASVKDNTVRKVDAATQVITTIAGTGVSGYSGDGGLATAAQLNFYNGLPGVTADKNGNVYISDYFNNRVRKIDAATKIITTIAGTGAGGYSGDGGAATLAKINGPAGIVTDASGNIYFADNNNSVIRRVDASTKVITTYAGSLAGSGGYSGDGGPAASAGLNYPECIALDKNGNLYISDEYNYVIRKVTAGTQVITTVAGNGTLGYGGDGGSATAAKLYFPTGVTVDYSGNIYIADKSNQRIRKVAAGTNIITTVAGTGVAGYSGDGGAAASAQINAPGTLQADAAGNVYICDANNNRVRKITVSTNNISTIVGDGTTGGFAGVPTALQAQLRPVAVTGDASGNFYIADGYYYDVRAINVASSSYIYAGNPHPDPKYASKGYGGNGGLASSGLYNAPFGVAIDASNNLYIADVFNNVIRKIAYSTKVVTTFAGTATAGYSGDGGAASAAKLNNPYGVAVDALGNVYIADALNNAIRKVAASTQVITTVAGTGAAGNTGDGAAAAVATLNNPQGVAVDGSGNIFILDRGNKKIRMVSASTLKISTVLNNGHVLSGVAVDASGNVFVSDSTTSTIIKLTAPSYTAAVIAGNGTAGYADNAGNATLGQLNYPGGLFVTGGTVYVADINNNVIRSLVPGTPAAQPLANNIISTVDSTATCSGSIALTTLTGTLPTGGSGSYTYQWLVSTNGSTYATIAGVTGQNYSANTSITSTAYYRRLVTSGASTDSGNILSFIVRTAPVPVIAGSGATTFCAGKKDTLSTTAAYTAYLWSTGETTAKIIDSTSNTVSVTVTDANGCKGTSAGVVITVNPLPSKPTITTNPAIVTGLCPGTTATLTSSSATSYLWSNNVTTAAINVTAAGNYSVTVKDANGCANTSAITAVTYNTCGSPAVLTTANLKSTTVTLKWNYIPCAVKYAIQYGLSSGTTYTLITTSNTDTTYNLAGLKASAKYKFQVRAICSTSPVVQSAYSSFVSFTTTSASASIANNIASTADSAATCTGKINITTLAGTLPTGGTGSYTYKWLQSSNNSTYTAISGATAQNYAANKALTATTYFRRLVTSGSLTDSSNVLAFKVNTTPAAVITTSALPACPGTTVTLTASAAQQYLWSTNATTASITTTAVGDYTVKVTDANGCSATSAPVAVSFAACAAPVTNTASSITASAAMLKWNKVPCAVKYAIQYGLSTATTYTLITTTNTDTIYTLTGLSSGTAYKFQVRAICVASPVTQSAYTKFVTFTTAASLVPGSQENTTAQKADITVGGKFNAILYPNPTTVSARLGVTGVTGKTAIIVSDMQGRKLWQAEINDSKLLTIPAEKFAAGMYLVTIINQNTSKVIKLVKQ